jgi:hypothetical protein
LVLEGFSGVAFFTYETFVLDQPIRERVHVQYDELLGWINIPSNEVRDIYGPGTQLTTNSQAFRSDHDFSRSVPPDKIRVICLGDSFTLGVEVSDHEAWVHRLGTIDQTYETINMGQAGYRLDQAYLWYTRDGVNFEHGVHVVALITEDFHRMKSSQFDGYGKPMIVLEEGSLAIKNVPVPRGSYFSPSLTRAARHLARLRTVNLIEAMVRGIRFLRRGDARLSDQEIREIAVAILRDLARLNAEKNSQLVLVYLPLARDYYQTKVDAWREYFGGVARQNGWMFIDVVEVLRELPPQEVEALYTSDWCGHFTAEGNDFVARLIHERLLQIPEIREHQALC